MRSGRARLLVALAGRPPRRPRAPLAGPLEVDVAIVGAGYTGLWTAYYLKRARPVAADRRARARDRRASAPPGATAAGCRASSRGPPARYIAALRPGRATWRCSGRCSRPSMRSARSWREHGIDADFLKGGQLEVALGARPGSAPARAPGGGARARASARRTCACSSRGGARASGCASRAPAQRTFSPHVARVHPAKLLRGPRAAPSRRWACEIYERTPVREIGPHAALTAAGPVARALGGAGDRGLHRLAARASGGALRADEQLDDRHRAAARRRRGSRSAGQGQELLGDEAHVYVYLQRTADGRIAIGGRGRPLPLRLAHRRRGRHGARDGRAACARKLLRDVPAGRAASRSTTPGRGCSACRATGACRSAPTPPAGSPGRAATSARGSRPRTSPRARCAT